MKSICARTGKTIRGFKYSSGYDETKDDEYPVLIKRFFNEYQLIESTSIPDGGDCGFYLMSSIVRNDHRLILKINELREHINLEPLFKFKNINNASQEILTHDWNASLRNWFALSLTKSSDIFSEYFHNISMDDQLGAMFIYNVKKNDYKMKDIRGQEVSSPKSKKTLFVVQGTDITIPDKKIWQSNKQKKFTKYPIQNVNESYLRIVLRYIFEFCLQEQVFNAKHLVKAVQKLVSFYPSSSGELGCFETDNSTIEWFQDNSF